VTRTAELGATIKAYPIRLIGDRAVTDTLKGKPIVLFSRTASGAVFLSETSGQKLTFIYQKGKFRDKETGSAWNLAGRATEGPLKGTSLQALPARRVFWFSVAGSVRGINLFNLEKTPITREEQQ
jgi:hypothetical protein